MKTIALRSNGSLWVELRQEGKRFLVKSYEFKRIVRMKWFRNIGKALNDFVEVCGVDEKDIQEILNGKKS